MTGEDKAAAEGVLSSVVLLRGSVVGQGQGIGRPAILRQAVGVKNVPKEGMQKAVGARSV